jgi:NADH dehydrogenase
MKIAITGGTGFVGGRLARSLLADGHEVVVLARGRDPHGEDLKSRLVIGSVDDESALRRAFAGCDAVAHCAGINLERGRQTYRAIHVRGTQAVVDAARATGVKKVLLLSFLRARPDCGSGYHESKWAAEEIVRGSGLDFTVLKPGVIYGRGDHMLDHLSHGLHTVPVFGLVGMRESGVAPLAVDDVVRVMKAALTTGALSRKTVAVIGPERLALSDAVRRVASVVGAQPLYVRLPVWVHSLMAIALERVMRIPLISKAQVRILSEGVVEPAMPCDPLPTELAPATRFTEEQIRRELPAPGPFGLADLRCCLSSR